MRNKIGQISIEVLVIITFVILLSGVVLFGIAEKNQKIEKLRQNLYAQKQAEKLASAISAAIYNGDGYTANITVSKYVGRAAINAFTVRPNSQSLEITWTDPFNNNQSKVVPIATKNINEITITGNVLNIKNNQSVITITQYVV